MSNAMAVAVGDYDAGAVCGDFFHEERNIKLFKQLRVLSYTDPAPGWLLTLKKGFPEKEKAILVKALLNLSPGNSLSKKVLSPSPWHGFVKPSGDELGLIGEKIRKYKIPESF